MRTVQHCQLFFQQGSSDKVYEVELCETGDGLFVVNFRYGRRGSNLREGTKTVFPVELAEATRIYDKLVSEKEAKGYRQQGEEAPTEAAPELVADTSARNARIVHLLKELVAGRKPDNWKASRLIWRAGALGIHEAEPHLKYLLDVSDPNERYAAMWSLGRLGVTDLADRMAALAAKEGQEEVTTRLATAYALGLGKPGSRYYELVRQKVLERLPEPVWEAVANKNPEALKQAMHELFFTSYSRRAGQTSTRAKNWEEIMQVGGNPLYDLYLLVGRDPRYQPIVHDLIAEIPFSAGFWRSVRYCYKTAEFWGDYPTLAIIGKGVAKKWSRFRRFYYSNTESEVWSGNGYVKPAEELPKPNSKLAFSGQTKDYFNKRLARAVRTAAEGEPANYIDLAKSILLCTSDERDREYTSTDTSRYWDWEAGQMVEETNRSFPKYSKFSAYNLVLFGGSERLHGDGIRVRYWFPFEEDAVDDIDRPREELNPEAWDAHPEAVLEVLLQAGTEEVASFAVKAARANANFADLIGEKELGLLLDHFSPPAVDLAAELLRTIYADKTPPVSLIKLLITGSGDLGRQLGLEWLVAYPKACLGETTFTTAIIQFHQVQLMDSLVETLSRVDADVPIAPLGVEVLQRIMASDAWEEEFVRALGNVLKSTILGRAFRNLTTDDIAEISTQRNDLGQWLAAVLIKINHRPTHELFASLLPNYLSSESQPIQLIGLELLGEFPDALLAEHQGQLKAFYFSDDPELRQGALPAVKRLMEIDPRFRHVLLGQLLGFVREAGGAPDAQEEARQTLETDFGEVLTKLPSHTILQLVLASTDAAQKLGEPLFFEQVDLAQLDIEELVSLTKSDILRVRQAFQTYAEANVARMRYELEEVTKLLNSQWDDVRQWGFGFLNESIRDQDWQFNQVIYICDHIRPDVQAFGRALVSRVFQSKHGEELLVKFAEHPTEDMRLFVTNYLDQYAKDKPALIEQLEPYFRTCLFGINRGAATKARVFQFLHREAIADLDVAKMAIALLTDVLATAIKRDQSKSLEILLDIHQRYPHLDLPLSLVEVAEEPANR